GAEIKIKNTYLGIAIEAGGKVETLPVATTDTLEYDLIRRIAKLSRRDAVKIAWQVKGAVTPPNLSAPPPLIPTTEHGPMNDLQRVDAFIQEEYETTSIDLKSKVPDEVKVLILRGFERPSETEKFWVDQFLMRGGGVIVMADGSVPQ